MGRNVLRDDRTRSDDRVVPDGHTGTDSRVRADPYERLDGDG